MVYRKQFHRRGHRGGETVWFLQIDTTTGAIRVHWAKTMKSGIEYGAMPPDAFVASGNRREHRILRSILQKMVSSFEVLE